MKIIQSPRGLIFLALSCLILWPKDCWANSGISGLFYLAPSVSVVLSFLLVWLVEERVALKFFPEKNRLALLGSLMVNLASTGLGALFLFLVPSFFSQIDDPLIVAIIFYFSSVLIETPLWKFFYRDATWIPLLKIGLIANTFSYTLLVIFILGDALLFGDFIFVPAIIILFINSILRFFTRYQKVSQQKRELLKMALFFPLFALLIISLFLFAKPPSNRPRDTRVKTALAQMRTIMVYTYGNTGIYDSFGTTSEDMTALASDVAKNAFHDGKTQDFNISRWPEENSTSCCIYARLNEKQGKTWFCVDSHGNAGTVSRNPQQDGYCGTSSKAAVQCPPIEE